MFHKSSELRLRGSTKHLMMLWFKHPEVATCMWHSKCMRHSKWSVPLAVHAVLEWLSRKFCWLASLSMHMYESCSGKAQQGMFTTGYAVCWLPLVTSGFCWSRRKTVCIGKGLQLGNTQMNTRFRITTHFNDDTFFTRLLRLLYLLWRSTHKIMF